MGTPSKILSALVLVLFCILPAKAQSVKFRHFGVKDGLCHPFVYTLNQDKNGYIWAGTGEGLCRFDGIEFAAPFASDSISSTSYGACSYKDKKGSLWFGHSDGSITVWDGRKVKNIKLPGTVTSTINGIVGDENGTIYAVSQNSGLIVISKEGEISLLDSLMPNQLLYSIALGTGPVLYIGTGDGLYLYSPENKTKNNPVSKFSSFPATKVLSMERLRNGNELLVGTEDMGVLQLQGKGSDPAAYVVKNMGAVWGFQESSVTSITQDAGKNLWISTQGEGVYELLWSEKDEKWVQKINFNELNGLANNFIRSVFQDREGIIWIATYGGGLDVLTGSALQFYSYDKELGRSITAIAVDGSTTWLAGTHAVTKVVRGPVPDLQTYRVPSIRPLDHITALYSDKLGNLWLGTEFSGVYKLPKGGSSFTNVFLSANSVKNIINGITGRNDSLIISTNEGLVYLNGMGKVLGMRTMTDLLPHNVIHQLLVSKSGRLLIATKNSGLYDITTNKTMEAGLRGEIEFTALTQDPQGNFWAGTKGNGIICFRADTVIQYTVKNGLASNFVYSIICDNYGMVWAGHRLAMSRISSTGHTIAVFGENSGINADCNPNAMAVSSDGVLMVGTTEGLITYDSRLDQNTGVPPALNIVSVHINDKEYDPSEPIVLKYGDYKLKIEFIGLNFRSPDRVQYQFMLKGFDKEWNDATTNKTSIYPVLRDGNYSFILKACNEDGQCTDDTILLNLRVKLPFWKIWWLWAIFVVLVIGAIYWAFKYNQRLLVEKNLKLEAEVVKRTIEVVQQKEVIESQNRDIMDSIEYAKRIQESVLPSASKLQGIFSGSFIYYEPKATVSGDFYWFDRVRGNKFLIVCADSTGHGVPGAFMSMMGTTLVKDICYRTDLDSPSEMLAVLDREIGGRLNQNLDGERANDGMDILICEVDLETCYVRIASAMRPFIIYRNGEQIYVQGSRSSIGGSYENQEEKVFEEKGFQLSKGDIIYMFSDGYTDQFGGPMGKKYKMVRLRNLLSHIHQMPMTEQRNFVMSNFNLWKSDFNQVDDVLFMGIQI